MPLLKFTFALIKMFVFVFKVYQLTFPQICQSESCMGDTYRLYGVSVFELLVFNFHFYLFRVQSQFFIFIFMSFRFCGFFVGFLGMHVGEEQSRIGDDTRVGCTTRKESSGRNPRVTPHESRKCHKMSTSVNRHHRKSVEENKVTRSGLRDASFIISSFFWKFRRYGLGLLGHDNLL